MQRVKDAERFEYDLNRPLPGLTKVSEEDLEEDAQSFMAFASVMGVQPPSPRTANGDDLPSAPAS